MQMSQLTLTLSDFTVQAKQQMKQTRTTSTNKKYSSPSAVHTNLYYSTPIWHSKWWPGL